MRTHLLFLFLAILPNFLKSQSNDDKKVRFGLRITPQPTWFTSADKNNIPAGARFGFGFGLNLEYKFSEVASFLTGIGGDFEGGTYRMRYDAGARYEVAYWQNDLGEIMLPRQNQKAGNTVYIINERKISSTFLSIPLILKLFTSEYNGLRYFGLFGGEFGIRLSLNSEDKYFESRLYRTDSIYDVTETNFRSSTIDISGEGAFPIRLGLHAGAGAEYKMGGTTSVFASISYFNSFINVFSNPSTFLTYRTDRVNGKETYQYVKQNLKIVGIRISIGLMF